MSFDRQAIERRDFPIGRRGYDPAAVDAHLRALANEIEELQRGLGAGAEPSLATTAGTQVHSILQAAESAAADIERQAQQAPARRARTPTATRSGRASRRSNMPKPTSRPWLRRHRSCWSACPRWTLR